MAKKAKRAEFKSETMALALRRQDSLCGACGVQIHRFGKTDNGHVFGEWVEAHHLHHASRGGAATLDNCVILCRSCHYSSHAGNFADNDPQIFGTPDDFVCFYGKSRADCAALADEMEERFAESPQSVNGSRRSKPG